MANGESLNTTRSNRDKLVGELTNRDYRRAYVEAHAKDTIAFQLRAMRAKRQWDQRKVAERLGNAALQPMISRYENPDYGKYSVTTLLELAAAFDVALMVRFVPFSELVDWDLTPNENKLLPPTFEEDKALTETPQSTVLYAGDSYHSTTVGEEAGRLILVARETPPPDVKKAFADSTQGQLRKLKDVEKIYA